MTRHGYTDDCNQTENEATLAQSNLNRAIAGKRGQRLLRDLLAALDAMPEKRLIAEALEITARDIEKHHALGRGRDELGFWGEPEIGVCALGCVGRARGMDLAKIDGQDPAEVARAFDISETLARYISYLNDEDWAGNDEGEKRWRRVRSWAASKIRESKP